MSTVSVINVSGKIKQSYIEELEKNEHSVRSVSSDDVESAIEQTDVIIIYNDVQQNMGEVCRLILKIREEAASFLWVFSKQNSETDRLVYLQLGANNNIDEDCQPEELQLIVKNAVSQHGRKNYSWNELEEYSEENEELEFYLNAKNQSVINEAGKEVELTRLEYRMMSIFSSAAGEAVGYKELHKELWGERQRYSKARIANLVFHLRTKLRDSNVMDIDIKTVRSQGYRLVRG